MDDLESLDSLFSQPQENPPRKDKKPLIPGFSVILAALCICGLIFWAVWEEAKPPDAVLSTPTETTEATEPTDPAEPGTLPVYVPDYPMFSEKPTESTAPVQYAFILDPSDWEEGKQYYTYYSMFNQVHLYPYNTIAYVELIWTEDNRYMYQVSGILPGDFGLITVAFRNKNTQEIVEQITVEITYDAETRTYDIVLVDSIQTATLLTEEGTPLQTDR